MTIGPGGEGGKCKTGAGALEGLGFRNPTEDCFGRGGLLFAGSFSSKLAGSNSPSETDEKAGEGLAAGEKWP